MKKIKLEAEELLRKTNLLKILEKYGKPFVHGSYFLDLMVWRDLDIYIETEIISTEKFFELGKELEQKIKPDQMHFKNGIIFPNDKIPKGLYWGINTKPSKELDSWKIDIWMVDPSEAEKFRKQICNFKESITDEKRHIILDIKNKYFDHKLYRKVFGSIDVYNAVLSGDVATVQQFKDWIKNNKNVDI